MNEAIVKIREFFNVQDGCICQARSTPKEHGKQFLINQKKGTSSVIWRFHVDGCLCTDQHRKKCDYAFLIENNNQYCFVELKGSDVKGAIKQLFNTIDLFHQALRVNKKCIRFSTYVVSSSYPREDTAVRNARARLLQEYNASIEVKVGRLQIYV